jgi:hypothetical protein
VDEQGRTADKFHLLVGHGESNSTPAGKYSLVVTARGYESARHEVEIVAGDTTSGEINLLPGEFVHVHVSAPLDTQPDARATLELCRDQDVIARFSTRKSSYGAFFSTRFGVGPGPVTIRARLGSIVAESAFEIDELPIREGERRLDLSFAGADR